MSYRHPAKGTMLPPVQTIWAEAKTIVESNPSIPGPLSFVTFDHLFGGENDRLAMPAFHDRKYHPGQYVIERGRIPDRVVTVVSGIAIIEANDMSAAEYRARLLSPAEVVGLVETLGSQPAAYNLIASTECTVRSITRRDLIRHIADHPELRSRVIRLLADLVRDADRFLKQL